MDIDELAHTLGVVFCGSPFGDLDLTPGPMRVEEDEQVDRSVAFIFAVGAFDLARLGWDRLANLADELGRALIETDHRAFRIGDFGVEVEHILHARDILAVDLLHPCCPAEADALCETRRRVEHGLTTVGLKIHCLGYNWELLNLIKALGGRSEVIGTRVYAHARASVTVILPPVGNARSAILLLECLERYFEHPIFRNPSYQIQVCSPCRLDGPRAAILALAFYLGSDVLRRYSLGDLTTTFSEDTRGGYKHRGRRIVLYDGEGDLDRDFEWWDLEKDRLSMRPQLPFVTERTDVLTCQSETDIENINLIATLLSHHQALAYWQHLGGRFVADVEALLRRHLLQGMLEACWIHPATGEKADDTQFFAALQELMAYAFDECARLEKEKRNQWWRRDTSAPPGILAETKTLLQHYRAELLAESERLLQEGTT